MNEKILSETLRMKSLFGYKRGVVISEQNGYESDFLTEDVTPKQQEALNAGYGPVTDEYAKSLPVGPDGKIIPKQSNPSLEDIQNLGKNAIQFGQNFLNKTQSTTQQKTNTEKYASPIELQKNVGNKTGVQAFQDWLDEKHSGWHSKYQRLDGNTNKGYGKYGPNTNQAWSTYKKEYLDQNPNLAQKAEKITPGKTTSQETTQTNQTTSYDAEIQNDISEYLKMPTQGTPDESHGYSQTYQDINNQTMTSKWDGYLHDYVLADWWDKKFNQDGTVKTQTQSPEIKVPQQVANYQTQQQPTQLNTDPIKYYESLWKAGLFKGVTGGKVKYKGPDLTDEQLNLLNTAFTSMGYEKAIDKGDKRYGQKYTWKKA